LQRWNPGNWGPLDLCGVINGQNAVADAISGAGCFATVGQTTGTRTGFAGVQQGFQQRYNSGHRIVVLPVTGTFPNGNGEVTIADFIVVQLLENGSGGGSNWQLDVQILGQGFGALRQFGLGPTRTLVE
jgi:hypothetical protein